MRIVIAEDSAVVRAGLVEILADRGHEVVAAVGNAEDLRAAVDEHQPDVTVVDVRPTCSARRPAAVRRASGTCSRIGSPTSASSSRR